MKVTIHQQGNYETSDGYDLTIKDIWYGANERIDFEVRGKLYSRTRKQFEQALIDKKIIKVI
jgi:hypothetical protein